MEFIWLVVLLLLFCSALEVPADENPTPGPTLQSREEFWRKLNESLHRKMNWSQIHAPVDEETKRRHRQRTLEILHGIRNRDSPETILQIEPACKTHERECPIEKYGIPLVFCCARTEEVCCSHQPTCCPSGTTCCGQYCCKAGDKARGTGREIPITSPPRRYPLSRHRYVFLTLEEHIALVIGALMFSICVWCCRTWWGNVMDRSEVAVKAKAEAAAVREYGALGSENRKMDGFV